MTASKSFLLLALFSTTACTSLGEKESFLKDIALGAAVGALAAQSKDNNQKAYTLMYSSIGAAAAGAVSGYKRISDLEKHKSENTELKEKLTELENRLKPKLIEKGTSLFSSPLPKEVSALVEPGEWKRYKLDEWVQDPSQPNTWFRQVEMFEITPPTAK